MRQNYAKCSRFIIYSEISQKAASEVCEVIHTVYRGSIAVVNLIPQGQSE